MRIDPQDISVGKFHSYLLSTVVPRPIAFAATINKEGRINLSPFSFFNAFGANPPILVFSPSRRGRDNTTKHTLDNILEVPETTVNIVNYPIVQQVSLASTEYEKGVNEFVKSGLTEFPSEKVGPPRVKEAPVSFECKVNQVIPLGEEGGAGNLVICQILLMHLSDRLLDSNGTVDPSKIDAVARMGGNWYSRTTDIFEVARPLAKKGIGVDNVPLAIRNSSILTGNDIGKLGNVEALPTPQEIEEFKDHDALSTLPDHSIKAVHRLAQELLEKDEVEKAWKVLLMAPS